MTILELPHRHVGRRVEILDQAESTNTLALERSRSLGPAADGLVVLARAQSAGRGQQGRSWQAPPGSSVLMSVILLPAPAVRRPVLLTAWAAVSVCEVIRQVTELPPRIKWPNDVLLSEKKVCGILIEQRSARTADAPATVAGIGLNVRQPASHFAEAGLPLAGSLHSLTGRLLETDHVARLLLRELDELYASLIAGETARLESLWRQQLQLLDETVTLETGSSQHEGKLRSISFTELILEKPAGDLLKLPPEAIRHIHRRTTI